MSGQSTRATQGSRAAQAARRAGATSGQNRRDTHVVAAAPAPARQYEPSQAEIDRWLDMAVKQGFPRKVSGVALAPIAALLRPHLESRARARKEVAA